MLYIHITLSIRHKAYKYIVASNYITYVYVYYIDTRTECLEILSIHISK